MTALAPAHRARLVAVTAEMAARARYRRDPVAWIVDVLGIPEHTVRWSLNPGYDAHAWDGHTDPLVLAATALAEWKDVGIEAGTGTQKSHTVACLILWFLDSWRDARVFTFAAKEEQLRLYIWAEITKLWPRFATRHPRAVLTDLKLLMEPGNDLWGAWGRSIGVRAGEEVATKAAGMHAEHMLLVIEETPGVPQAVVEAHENTCTAPHNLRLYIGNPDHQGDPLHRFCSKPSVVAIRISGLDHPNVVCRNPGIVPGAVSQKSIDERLQTYGEDHRLYQSRVRGVSPTEAEDALIRYATLRDAVKRSDADKRALAESGPRAIGADIANSESGDRGSIAFGRGALLERVESHASPDANAFARLRLAPLVGPSGVSATHVGIDSVGVGAGAVNEMTRLRKPVVALNGGMSPVVDPRVEEEFVNLRSQMYWTFAMELFHGEVAIQREDAELFADLTTPTWGTRNGKIFVESKEELKKRLPGGRSPDKGDAAVYWNWVRKPRTAPRTFRPASRSSFTVR